METPQVNGSTGIEKAVGVQPQEQQGGQQAANADKTSASPVDVVTISQEAQDINTRATETANPTPPANNAETTRERDVAQTVQNNLNEEANTDKQGPENADSINKVA